MKSRLFTPFVPFANNPPVRQQLVKGTPRWSRNEIILR